LAGVGALLRLVRWRGHAVRREPLLWVLHLGYAWVGLGFLLLAGIVPALSQISALHAFTAGAIGTMILAVMTRASLGHTGRPLVAGPMTRTIYALVTAAAILRVVAPLWGDIYAWIAMLTLSATAWVGAFGLFAFAYSGALTRRRSVSEAVQPI
jgi:uncharacterized protein involved in response to NO